MTSHKGSANERHHDAPIDRRRRGLEHPNRERPGAIPHPARRAGSSGPAGRKEGHP